MEEAKMKGLPQRIRVQRNGAWQRPELFEGDYPQPDMGSFLSIDTECTGLNPYVPLPGFTYAALPFSIQWCEVSAVKNGSVSMTDPDCITGTVDPWTRNVTFKPGDVHRFLKKAEAYTRWVFHNALFDLKLLLALGRHLRDVTNPSGDAGARLIALVNARISADAIEDTLGASHVMDSQEAHGLKKLCVKYLDIPDEDESILIATTARARELAKERGIPIAPDAGCDYWLADYLGLSCSALRDYGLRDTVRAARLWMMYRRVLVKEGLWHNYVRERKSMTATHRMQSNPIHLNPRVHEIKADYESRRTTAENKVWELTDNPDLNLRSPQQLANLLHNQLGLPILAPLNKPSKAWPAGTPCADKHAVHALHAYAEEQQLTEACEVLDEIAACRKMTTACNYLSQYLEHSVTEKVRGRTACYLRSNFNPWGTAENGLRTTRFSSNDPNLQNVGSPDEENEVNIREVFSPPPGYDWLSLDFNQLELRIMAKQSGDPTLSRILGEGLDQHQITTDSVNLLRCGLSYWPMVKHKDVLEDWRSRVVQLGIGPSGYGLPPIPRKMGKNLGFAWNYGAGANKLSTMAGVPAENFKEAMAGAYPGVTDFMYHASNFARKHGYITTLFGYRLYVDRTDSYKACNYAIQGCAGDILKSSMIAAYEIIDSHGINSDLQLIMCIHDELVLQAKKKLPVKYIREIKESMDAAGLPVGFPTPAECKIIRRHWGQTEKFAL
jgi:DNA polymerase I-like protein with 3'-5' exonuclease and polymerase domains